MILAPAGRRVLREFGEIRLRPSRASRADWCGLRKFWRPGFRVPGGNQGSSPKPLRRPLHLRPRALAGVRVPCVSNTSPSTR